MKFDRTVWINFGYSWTCLARGAAPGSASFPRTVHTWTSVKGGCQTSHKYSPNCHIWRLEEFWKQCSRWKPGNIICEHGARGSADPWQCPRVSIHCPEQNNRERFIHSECQPLQLVGSAVGRPSDSAGQRRQASCAWDAAGTCKIFNFFLFYLPVQFLSYVFISQRYFLCFTYSNICFLIVFLYDYSSLLWLSLICLSYVPLPLFPINNKYILSQNITMNLNNECPEHAECFPSQFPLTNRCSHSHLPGPNTLLRNPAIHQKQKKKRGWQYGNVWVLAWK